MLKELQRIMASLNLCWTAVQCIDSVRTQKDQLANDVKRFNLSTDDSAEYWKQLMRARFRGLDKLEKSHNKRFRSLKFQNGTQIERRYQAAGLQKFSDLAEIYENLATKPISALDRLLNNQRAGVDVKLIRADVTATLDEIKKALESLESELYSTLKMELVIAKNKIEQLLPTSEGVLAELREKLTIVNLFIFLVGEIASGVVGFYVGKNIDMWTAPQAQPIVAIQHVGGNHKTYLEGIENLIGLGHAIQNNRHLGDPLDSEQVQKYLVMSLNYLTTNGGVDILRSALLQRIGNRPTLEQTIVFLEQTKEFLNKRGPTPVYPISP